MKLRLFLATLMLTLLCFSHQVSAQDTSVVVLKFEEFNVDQSISAAFYSGLVAGIEEHPDMKVSSSGELTLQDLMLVMGCESPNVECLSGLSAMVPGNQMVFGQVQQSDDVVLFTIRQFDFAEQRFVREVSEMSVKGTAGKIIDAVPAVIENFLYGPVGVLEVAVEGGSPELFLNGDKVGRAPTILENLPLGEHVVMVRDSSGVEKSETVILRRGETGVVSFNLGGVADPGSVSGAPSAVPGWILVGVGVAGVGFGVFQTLEVGRIDDDFAALCAEPGNVCEGSDASLSGPEAASRARTLADDGGTAKTLQLVGFSVGGAALAVGGYLLYRSYSYSGEETVSFQISPSKDGFQAGMGIKF